MIDRLVRTEPQLESLVINHSAVESRDKVSKRHRVLGKTTNPPTAVASFAIIDDVEPGVLSRTMTVRADVSHNVAQQPFPSAFVVGDKMVDAEAGRCSDEPQHGSHGSLRTERGLRVILDPGQPVIWFGLLTKNAHGRLYLDNEASGIPGRLIEPISIAHATIAKGLSGSRNSKNHSALWPGLPRDSTPIGVNRVE